MSTILLQSLSLILSLLGTVAVIILALKLLTNAQTKLTLGVKLKVRRANGMQFAPWPAAITGFVNAVTTGNTLRATSTLFSGIHAKMVSKDAAGFMMLGVAQSHIITVAITALIIWVEPSISVALTLAGIGLVISPIFKKEGNLAVPRIIISAGLLIIGIYYFMVFANQSINLLGVNLYEAQEFLNFGPYAVILGALIGVLMVIAIKHIDAVLIALLVIGTAPIAPFALLFGAMIGASLGGIFYLVPIAENEGAIAKKIIIRHTLVVVIAIVLSALTMPYVINIIVNLGGAKSVLPIVYVIHMIVIMWGATWIAKPLSKLIEKKIPETEKRVMRLKVLSSRIRPDSTLSLILAHNETINHVRRTYKMMSFVRDMLNSDGEKEYINEMSKRVTKYNEITKRVESEVLSYVCTIALDDLSKINTVQMQRVIVAMNTVAHIASEVCDLSNLVNKGLLGETPLVLNQKIIIRNKIVQLQALVYEAIALKSKKPSDIKIQEFYQMFLNINKELEPLANLNYDDNQVLMIEAIWQINKINRLIIMLVPQCEQIKNKIQIP